MVNRSHEESDERWTRFRVLIVDEERAEARRLARQLEGAGYETTVLADGEGAYNLLDEQPVDGVICQARGGRVDGVRLLSIARRRNPDTCGILIAEASEVDAATRALSEGAHDFQTRPLNFDKIVAVLRRAEQWSSLRARVNELERRLDRKFGLHNFVGNSAAMASVVAKILQIAPTDTTVLITGETGTGKELVATALHQNSGRRHAPFVKLHCGDLAEGLVESELFGHERGAFSGAVTARKGRFELADGGSLLLDGVSELSAGVQAKLLRVLEAGEFMKVGGDRSIRADVRLIGTTSRDLRELVAAGQFREDLFYRLNVVTIEMPPLRHRRQDVPLYIEHFLREAAGETGRPQPVVAPRAMGRLVRYGWPGNVRELKNTMTGLVLAADATRPIDVDDLPPAIRVIPDEGPGLWIPVGTSLAEVERRLIDATFESTNSDRLETARLLGLSLRTLARRLAAYGTSKRSKGQLKRP